MVLQTVIFFVALAVAAALFLLLPKSRRTKRFGITAIAIALLLELFFFNFHSFHLFLGGYERTELSLEDATVSGPVTRNDDGTLTVAGGSTASIGFGELGIAVGTVYIDCVLPDREWSEDDVLLKNRTDYVAVDIDATDVTQSAYPRYGVGNGRIVFGNTQSRTIVLNLSGEVDTLTLRLTGDGEYGVRGITLNRSVPLSLSPLRFLLILLLAYFLYALLTFPTFTEAVGERSRLLFGSTAAVTGIFVIAAIALTLACQYNRTGFLFSDFLSPYGNQITKELVDAFEAGQVSLLETPPRELLELENPYDWSERINSNVSYLWDHLLYEGKYYSYYGIAPVLLLFLPYHLLTGYYFPSAEAILLFGVVGIVFLSLLFYEVVCRFFPRIPHGMAILALLTVQLSSGIWYCFVYNNFYEIAQASGFMFTSAGFYFLIRSGVVGGERLAYPSLVLSSVCLAFAVLCRPTLAVYCVVALLFLGFGYYRRIYKPRRERGERLLGATVRYLLSALTAYAVIGGIQMVYNYLRFGNFMDFGIQYSLTINDFTASQYHTDFAAIGFYNFLFAFPAVRPDFPFIFSSFSTLDVNGYYFIANTNAIGILWRALPCFGYLGALGAYRRLERSHRLPALLLVGSTAVVAPLVIIFSIWESGYGVRYSADFAWQILFGALAILFFRYTLIENDEKKADMRRMMMRFFAVSFVVAFFANFAMIYDYLPRAGYLESNYLSFARIFEFWK